MIAVHTVFRLQFPVAVIGVCLRPRHDFEFAVRILVDDHVEKYLGVIPMVDEVGHVLRKAAENEAAIAFDPRDGRSEEHTSELQSLMRLSYAASCWSRKHA